MATSVDAQSTPGADPGGSLERISLVVMARSRFEHENARAVDPGVPVPVSRVLRERGKTDPGALTDLCTL